MQLQALMHFLGSVVALVQLCVAAAVPLLTVAFVLALPYVALRKLRPLLSGLLDLTALQAIAVTVAACLASWSAMLTFRVTYIYRPLRISHVWPADGFPKPFPSVTTVVTFAFVTLPLMVSALIYSTREELPANRSRRRQTMLAGIALGYALAAASVAVVDRVATWANDALCNVRPLSSVASLSVFQGYLSPSGLPLPAHVLATVAFALVLGVYVFLGIAHRERWPFFRDLPSLGYVLLLLALICWFLSGLSFFLDKYRIPLLLVVAALLAFTALFSKTDYYYNTFAAQEVTPPPTPAEVLDASLLDSVILVAATGGGIQSSAWTVRVLTELQAMWIQKHPEDPHRFSHAIRAISSVSGGSVGAVFFTAAYDDAGRLPITEEGLSRIQRFVETSSINDIAWGICYGDFLRTVSVFSWKYFADRGRAFEGALTWINREIKVRLSTWREAVSRGLKPANLFNGTVVESGDRLLIGTSQFATPPPACAQFYSLYQDYDLAAVTAARLSAGFPYVSPAARSDIGGAATPQFHIVDGGYYDYYGMATLTQWVQAAMPHCNEERAVRRRLMVLQIRGFPPSPPQTPTKKRGWLYQLMAPPEALLNTRTCGQLAHNDLEFEFMREICKREAFVDTKVFPYDGPEEPPLSWHMTPAQIESLQQSWLSQNNQSAAKAVLEFLSSDDRPRPTTG